MWSFHMNPRTFHFSGVQFPQYVAYIQLLNASFPDDAHGVSLPLRPTSLPPDLEAGIKLLALEAMDPLGH